jgi:hypothetical protein
MCDSDGIELASFLVRFKHLEFPPKLSLAPKLQRRHTAKAHNEGGSLLIGCGKKVEITVG